MIEIMNPKQDHHTSQTRTNPGTAELAITIHDRLQRQDKIHPSRISAVNPD